MTVKTHDDHLRQARRSAEMRLLDVLDREEEAHVNADDHAALALREDAVRWAKVVDTLRAMAGTHHFVEMCR